MVQVVSLRPSETMRFGRVKDNASDGGNYVTRPEETNLNALLNVFLNFSSAERTQKCGVLSGQTNAYAQATTNGLHGNAVFQ